MVRQRVRAAIAVAVAVGVVAAVVTGAAQEATPAFDVPGEMVAPDPDECRVEPRSDASLAALVASPAAATPETPDFEALVAEGEAADAAIVEAVSETVHEIYACLNAGEPLRAYALYSDDALRALFTILPPLEPDFATPTGTPPAPSPEEWTAVRVRDVRILADGRVTAFVDGLTPAGGFALFGVFVRQGDRYLIDAFVTTSYPSATPTT